ncbi:hypothetical protein LVJ94_15985 [Pendulispora rubella]|uniref:Tetratricopeptide repeat protein n=1 Tax=Pendulispora rubella TaxID=2741070 RepID=A0ABZ2LFQ4_9BACT
MRTNRGAVLLTALLLYAGPVRAEPTAHERASASFQQARAAFARREFTAAAAAFEQAAEYEPHPVAWLNAAEAWARADDPVRAATDCDRVLEDRNAAATYRDEAKTRLEALGQRVATADVRGNAGSLASLDGGPTFSLPARKRMTAGSHVVTVTEGGPPRRFPITVRLGETALVDATPPPPPASPPAPEARALAVHPVPNTSKHPPTATWIAFGVSGAALASATVFGFRTMSAHDDFDNAPTNDTRDAFYRERLATNVSLGVALVAAGVGLTLWLLAPSASRK